MHISMLSVKQPEWITQMSMNRNILNNLTLPNKPYLITLNLILTMISPNQKISEAATGGVP